MKNAVFLYSEQLEKYSYPKGCPFKIERTPRLRKTLASMGLLHGHGRREVEPQPAARHMLEIFHTPRYLDALKASENGGWDIDALHMGIGGPDTPVFKGMHDYGALACGATLYGADLLLSGEADIVFNSFGGFHHAGPELAAGFCYINDVAIACLHLAQRGQRVLYLDIDVHHGDGVQNSVYDRKEVMTISMHESGRFLFPGTGFEDEIGEGEGRGFSVNMPLPPRTYNDAFMRCFNEIAIPLINTFDADIFVFELGADGLAGDPLAHLKLTNDVYQRVLEFLLSQHKPLLMTGGGGYNIDNTVRAWSLAWSVATGVHEDAEAMKFGLGGVMLESTDWMGGFHDHDQPVTDEQRRRVDPEIEKTIRKLKDTLFPIHGL
ncbi:acetoin utilization protein AcuC [candidate division KSB1 bacterium]|nr:acetoin utilization protein AcuC [candidate division KSB1 bacterium]RQW05231.1 MAG: acetoin utilization protein AcuC [candidate division KSB1 bacterium]